MPWRMCSRSEEVWEAMHFGGGSSDLLEEVGVLDIHLCSFLEAGGCLELWALRKEEILRFMLLLDNVGM